MKKTILYTLGALVTLGILAFLWWTVSPLFIDRIVDEEFDYQVTAEDNVEHAESDTAPGTTPLPQVMLEGSFVGADSLHRGSGVARIIETEEGSVLRLEDFEVTNGPDLFVVLAESSAPGSHDEFGEYVELARLKGNIGNQTYKLPADIDPSAFGSVVVYCKAFSVVFATATLR